MDEERKETLERLKDLEEEYRENIAEIKELKAKYKFLINKLEEFQNAIENGTLTKKQIKAFRKLDKYVKI